MTDTSGVSSTPSGLTGAGGGNMLRITGMATGLDVDGMVKKMMAAEQVKVDKAKQDRQIISWRQEAYQDIIKDLKDFQSTYFDPTSPDKNILSSVNFSPYDVSGVNGAIATVTTGAGAQPGTYTLKVTSLAKGAGVQKTLAAGIKLSTKLSTIDASLTGNLALNLNVNGSPVNLNIDNSSGNMTVQDMLTAINNQGAGKVTASYSEVSGKFSLLTAQTGNAATMNITSGTSNASLLNFLNIDTSATGDTDKDLIGSNANFSLVLPGDPTEYPITDKTSNNFTIDGINYNLQGAGSTTFSLSQNTQKVYDKIKGFIDKYNTIVDKIQTKLTEKKDYDYSPLTDSQKSGMKDADITAWNDKAKQGLLRNDDNLEILLQNLREAFTTSVSNSGLAIGKYGANTIGLDFSVDYTKPDHIDIIDDTKLKNAIATNGSNILKMFTNVSSTSLVGNYDATNTTYQEDGIFTRVKNLLENNVGLTNTYLNSSILTRYANYQDDYSPYGSVGSNTLPDQLFRKDTTIKTMTDALNTKQESYYRKFSQLETAMNQLNSQQAWLSQQLGG